jgi:hypothetical protein
MDVEKDKGRFLSARGGDHLMVPFQCDTCHFRNVYGRDPDDRESDKMPMILIRRVILDSFCAREEGTVKGNYGYAKSMAQKAAVLGIPASKFFPAMGPWPLEDTFGMGIAMVTLFRSLDKGINEDTIQYNSTRKFQSVYSNIWGASLEGDKGSIAVKDTVKMYTSDCPTNKQWYSRFLHGLHARVGDSTKQDMAISIEVMHALMDSFEKDWIDCSARGAPDKEKAAILFPALFSIVTFCASLRGEETPLMEVSGALKHFEEGRDHPKPELKHVALSLLGRFKTETGEQSHFIPLVWETRSGLQIGVWIERMVVWYRRLGISHGPVFRKANGKRIASSAYSFEILSRLQEIQRKHPELIAKSVNVFEDYGIRRSFRRGSDAEALNQGVDTVIINAMNRWRTVEEAKGKAPKLKMIAHYADLRLMLRALLQYSRPM